MNTQVTAFEQQFKEDMKEVCALSDTEEMALSDLYRQLVVAEDIIITIDAVDEPVVRKGLIGIKARDNRKMKDNGIVGEATVLEFHPHAQTVEMKAAGTMKLQIVLKKRAGVKIHSLIIPENDGNLL